MRTLISLILTFLSLNTAHATPTFLQLPRDDGTIIHYSLDMPDGNPNGLIVLAQGSGCLPGAQNHNLKMVRTAFPHHAALIVEKTGVAPDAAISEGFTDCPQSFHEQYTFAQRVSDYEHVLDHVRQTKMRSGELILFGGSEGGFAVTLLARHAKPDAVIILSSASGMEFGEMVLSTIPPEGQVPVQAGFEKARQNPESSELFAGSSLMFWADILDRKPLDDLIEIDAPILVIQGGRDRSSPVQANHLTTATFAEEERCNLTYWEFPGLDHGMAAPTGKSYMRQVIAMAATWAKNPLPGCPGSD